MPYSCWVPGCKSNYSSSVRASVFSFPQDEILKNEWVKAINRADRIPTKSSKICLKHFKSEDIVTEATCFDSKAGVTLSAPLKVHRLRIGAIPVFFPKLSSPLKKKKISVSTDVTSPKMEEQTVTSNELDTEPAKKPNSSPKFHDTLVSPYKNMPSVSVCLKEEDIVEISKESGRTAKRVLSYGSNSSSCSNEVKPLAPPQPKRKRVEKPPPSVIGRQNDCFCWSCHKENVVLFCMACPRAYHQKCVSDVCEITLPDWVCPECVCILAAEDVDTRSSTLTEISLDNLCGLLKLWISKMRQRAPVAFHHPVSLDLYPAYPQYVIHPMDLSLLEKNIKQKLYGCTEAFLADVKWILHNSCVFNGTQHPLSTNARSIIKTCETDMQELEICPDCFKHSIIRNKYWFSEVCRKPHPIVWAKLKGFPYWPAKVVRISGGNVDARFFGAHDRAWVPIAHCYNLCKETPTSSKPKKKGNYETALDELNVHVHLLIQKFGTFEYAPYRTVFDPDNVKLAYHGIDINKTVSEDTKFDNAITLSCEFDSPTKERFPINETESEIRSDSDTESKNQQSNENSANSLLTENLPLINEKTREKSNHESFQLNLSPVKNSEVLVSENIDNEENSSSSVISKKSNADKDNSPSEDPLPKSDSLDQLRKLELALERIKGYVCNNDDQDKSETNKEVDTNSKSDNKTNAEQNENEETGTSNSTFKPVPTMSVDMLSTPLEEHKANSSTEIINVSKKKDSFFLKLNETIESCKAKLGIDEIVEEESSSENESGDEENENSEDDDAENSADDDDDDDDEDDDDIDDTENADAPTEERRPKSASEEADEAEEAVEENESGNSDEESSESSNSDSENDSNVESSETDIEEITVESNDTNDKLLGPEIHSNQQNPVISHQKEIIEEVILDSNEATFDENSSMLSSTADVTINLLNSESKPTEPERNAIVNDTDKNVSVDSETSKQDTLNINKNAIDPKDKTVITSPSKTESSQGFDKSSLHAGEKESDVLLVEFSEKNEPDSKKNKSINLSHSKSADEDDDIYICPPVKPPTPPLICLGSCSETEPEGESITSLSSRAQDTKNIEKSNMHDFSSTKTILSVKNEIKNKMIKETTRYHVPRVPKKRKVDKSSSGSCSSSSSDESSDEYSVHYVSPLKRPLTGAKRTFRKTEVIKNTESPSFNSTQANPSNIPSNTIAQNPSSNISADNQNQQSSSSCVAVDTDNRNTDIASVLDNVTNGNNEISGKNENVISNFHGMDKKDAEIARLNSKLREAYIGVQIQAWKFAQEREELRHNMNLIIMEMRASLEMDKKISIENLMKRIESEKSQSIDEAKRKQWCAFCLQESRYSCCWNTSYCTFNCQKQHFAEHHKFCTQLKGKLGLDNRSEFKLKLQSSNPSESSENKNVFVVNVKQSDALKSSDTKVPATLHASVPKSPIVVSKNSIQIVKNAGTVNSPQVQVLPNKSIQVVFSPKITEPHIQSPSQLSTSQATSMPVVSAVVSNKQDTNSQSTTGTISENLDSTQIIHRFRNKMCNLDTAISLLNKKNQESSCISKKGDKETEDKVEEHFSTEKNSRAVEAVHLNTDELQDTFNDDEDDKQSDVDESAEEKICESFFNERSLILSDEDQVYKDSVNIGHGVDVKAKFINNCIVFGNTYKKLTRCLVDALFPDIKLLASCSAFGQKSSVTKLTQAALPARKVAAVIDFVQKRFPKSTRNEIVTEINLKCKEAKYVVSKLDENASAKKLQVVDILQKELEKSSNEKIDETLDSNAAHSITTPSLSSLKKFPNVVAIKRSSLIANTPSILMPRKPNPNYLRCTPPLLIQPKPANPAHNAELQAPVRKRVTVRNLLDATKVDYVPKATNIVSLVEKSKTPAYLSQPVPHQNYPLRPYFVVGSAAGKQSTSSTQVSPVPSSSSPTVKQ